MSDATMWRVLGAGLFGAAIAWMTLGPAIDGGVEEVVSFFVGVVAGGGLALLMTGTPLGDRSSGAGTSSSTPRE